MGEKIEVIDEEFKIPTWKAKLTTMEWLAEQPEILQSTYNGYIRLMVKCSRENRYNDKQYRMMPYHQFKVILEDFLTHYQLKSDEDFLGSMLKLLSPKDTSLEI